MGICRLTHQIPQRIGREAIRRTGVLVILDTEFKVVTFDSCGSLGLNIVVIRHSFGIRGALGTDVVETAIDISKRSTVDKTVEAADSVEGCQVRSQRRNVVELAGIVGKDGVVLGRSNEIGRLNPTVLDMGSLSCSVVVVIRTDLPRRSLCSFKSGYMTILEEVLTELLIVGLRRLAVIHSSDVVHNL